MIFCGLTLSLFFPGSCSLKSKRKIISQIKTGLKNKVNNISIIEVNNHNSDLWQRVELAVSFVTNTQREADCCISSIIEYIEQRKDVHLISNEVKYF